MRELDFDSGTNLDEPDRGFMRGDDEQEIDNEDHDWCVSFAPHKFDMVAMESRYIENSEGKPKTLESIMDGHRRRAEQAGTGCSIVDSRDWYALVHALRSGCAYCGDTIDSAVVEHVVPISRGGDHSIFNVVPACASCNLSKRNKSPEEWLGAGVTLFLERMIDALGSMKQKSPPR